MLFTALQYRCIPRPQHKCVETFTAYATQVMGPEKCASHVPLAQTFENIFLRLRLSPPPCTAVQRKHRPISNHANSKRKGPQGSEGQGLFKGLGTVATLVEPTLFATEMHQGARK